MNIKDDLIKLQNKMEKLEEQSLAMEMYKDSKKANKRMALCYTIIIIVMFISQVIETVYLVHILNDINTVEETTTVAQENESGHNNYIGNDGDINYGTTNN